MSNAKKSTAQPLLSKSLVRTDYITRNKPVNFFTEKRNCPFNSPLTKPSSEYKTQYPRRQSLATTQPYTFNQARKSLQQTMHPEYIHNDDERVNSLIEFFGSVQFALNKGQVAFALYSLGYLSKPTLPHIDDKEYQIVDVMYNQLRDKFTNKVPLDLLIKFIEMIEALQKSELKLERINYFNQKPEPNKFRSPDKENNHRIVNSDLSFNNLQTKEQHKSVVQNMSSTIGRFSFGAENFNTLNKPQNSNSKSLEKSVIFTATVDLEGCKKILKVFKGDSLQFVAKKFAENNQLSDKQYNKLYRSLVRRFNNANKLK